MNPFRSFSILIALLLTLALPTKAQNMPNADGVILPQYPGGISALTAFISRHMQYPPYCQQHYIEGRVIVNLIVEADGTVQHTEVLRSAHPLLDAEALRIIGYIPRWIPGTKEGKPVRVQFQQPVTFRIPNKIIAHRGLWDAPGSAQNSIAALTKADEAGVYGSEFDVQITADGVAVVNHDATIFGLRIEDTPYQQLRKLRLLNGEPLPTLEQYLKHAKKLKNNTRLILEIKPHRSADNEQRCVDEVLRLVKKYRLEERTDYISFSKNICQMLPARIVQEAKVAYLGGDLTPQQVADMGLDGIDYEQSVLRKHPEWIDEARQLRLTVNVWTVNDDNDLRYFIDKEVDYITTNRPVEAMQLAR